MGAERVGQGGRRLQALQAVRALQDGLGGKIRARRSSDGDAAAEAQGRPRIVHVHVDAAQVQDGQGRREGGRRGQEEALARGRVGQEAIIQVARDSPLQPVPRGILSRGADEVEVSRGGCAARRPAAQAPDAGRIQADQGVPRRSRIGRARGQDAGGGARTGRADETRDRRAQEETTRAAQSSRGRRGRHQGRGGRETQGRRAAEPPQEPSGAGRRVLVADAVAWRIRRSFRNVHRRISVVASEGRVAGGARGQAGGGGGARAPQRRRGPFARTRLRPNSRADDDGLAGRGREAAKPRGGLRRPIANGVCAEDPRRRGGVAERARVLRRGVPGDRVPGGSEEDLPAQATAWNEFEFVFGRFVVAGREPEAEGARRVRGVRLEPGLAQR